VLLSPACASFDWFQNYEHRGRVFKDIVMKLEAQQQS
jgi:UDP-N-acetylmuramoylalanine--D-glutamate ligase